MKGNTTDVITVLQRNSDDFFLLVNGIILILMQCGFACLECGAVRSKNTTNIMIQNVMDVFFSCVGYWLFGYALAYGEGNAVIGWTYWAGKDLPEEKFAHWFFNFGFAATAATIVTGAVAERCNFITYIAYSFLISGIIYPAVTHWTWSEGGWLKTLGYIDFSGCGPIHLLGGVCSFWAAILLGPRIGRFGNEEEKEELVGHSVPLLAIGGLLLFVGFLAFNGGSLYTISQPGDGALVARIIINTLLAGAGGSILILFASKIGLLGQRTWNFSLTLNASLTGMVSVCAGVDKMEFWASFTSGATAAIIFILIHYAMIWILVDDPLDTVAVHFGGGIWGLISASFLAKGGLFYGASRESALLLGHRMIGAGAIILWTTIASTLMFGILKLLGKLRVKEQDEIVGLDISMHNELGYNPMGWRNFFSYVTLYPPMPDTNGNRHEQRLDNLDFHGGITNPVFNSEDIFDSRM